MKITYGVTHCPHCEKPYSPDYVPPVDDRYCYGTGMQDVGTVCSHLSPLQMDEHLIAVLQERDKLRAELAQVHNGQLSLLAALA